MFLIILTFLFLTGLCFAGVVLRALVSEKPEYWRAVVGPPRWREALAVVMAVACFDVCVFRAPDTPGAGMAVFLGLSPILFATAFSSWKRWKALGTLTLMLWCTAGKFLYSGMSDIDKSFTTFPALMCACVILVLLTAAALEIRFRVAPLLRFLLSGAVIAIPRFFGFFLLPFRGWGGMKLSGSGCASVVVPVAVVSVFGGIFLLANLDFLPSFESWEAWISDFLRRFDGKFQWLPTAGEWVTWLVLGVLFAGLLAARTWKAAETPDTTGDATAETPAPFPLFAMCRNTLVGVVGVFAASLIYELYTRLTWTPPEGFCFGTYCHEGAAWLTVALALTTCILTAIFAKGAYRDPRLATLKVLAGVWLCENLLMAAAIYVRLWIYVQQTGLTCLRVVGFFGTTTIAVALVWVGVKIFRRRSTTWLLYRYAFTAAVIFWLICVSPIDALVWRYNTRVILGGNNGPLVHIAAQSISREGKVQIMPLLASEDPMIRKGVAARVMFATPTYLLNSPDSRPDDWRTYDYVTESLCEQLEFYAPQLKGDSWAALKEFHEYGEQFYR